jgi:hypothetical protein
MPWLYKSTNALALQIHKHLGSTNPQTPWLHNPKYFLFFVDKQKYIKKN